MENLFLHAQNTSGGLMPGVPDQVTAPNGVLTTLVAEKSKVKYRVG